MSVDPLTGKYPWYTPYQFAGNKPMWKVDLDGAEEKSLSLDLGDPGDAASYLTVKGIWDVRNSVSNLALRANPTYEKLATVSALEQAGINDPEQIRQLLDYVTVRYETITRRIGYSETATAVYEQTRELTLVPKNGPAAEALASTLDLLTLASIMPAQGSPLLIAEETKIASTATLTDILSGLSIQKRADQMAGLAGETTGGIRDMTRGGKDFIDHFEAESGAILENTFNIKLRQLRPGEQGDYAIESGKINGIDASGKTVDQFGIPKTAVEQYDIGEFFASIDSHFRKKGVDYLLIDARNLSEGQKSAVINYLNKNYGSQLNKVITIGLNK